jgi:lipoprotein NlpD
MPASRAVFTALPPLRMPLVWGGSPLCGVLAVALLLGACGSSPSNRAPVEDRGASRASSAPVTVAVPVPVHGDPYAAAGALPGAENAGKPGYYTVKPGDTLIRIGLDNGQNWRDVVRWNALSNPNQIEVGQVLRVAPPVAAAGAAGAPVPASGAATRPVQSGSATPMPVPPVGVPGAAPAVASVPAAPAANPDDDIAWIWPASGNVLAGFDEVKNKGVDIGGTSGAPVMAAADGRVVYVGAGLRGYGNLIILKHNNTYLTAYAHNQALLVKEDQTVRKGQKIAEMGDSDADRVKLHFEVRRQGKPVDPAKYLPPR